MNYSWTRRGERKRVCFENPQGRRLNLLAAITQTGPLRDIDWITSHRHLSTEEFLHFLFALPALPVPRVVVLDNGSLHKSNVVKAAMPDLWARRIYLYYLPPYSPELNEIEPLFQHLKHHEMPQRSYTTIDALKDAVDDGLTHMAKKSTTRREHELRLAA